MDSPLEVKEGINPAKTLILDFWFPEVTSKPSLLLPM
jgi:hypothetical protein